MAFFVPRSPAGREAPALSQHNASEGTLAALWRKRGSSVPAGPRAGRKTKVEQGQPVAFFVPRTPSGAAPPPLSNHNTSEGTLAELWRKRSSSLTRSEPSLHAGKGGELPPQPHSAARQKAPASPRRSAPQARPTLLAGNLDSLDALLASGQGNSLKDRRAKRSSAADVDGVGLLIPCAICNRKFAQDRIAKHREICQEFHCQKRGVFQPDRVYFEGGLGPDQKVVKVVQPRGKVQPAMVRSNSTSSLPGKRSYM